MNNPIIESRLNKMIQKKKSLLKLKKAERGNELKETERVIANLKKWLADPATHVQTPQQEQCITGNPAGHFKDTQKGCENNPCGTGKIKGVIICKDKTGEMIEIPLEDYIKNKIQQPHTEEKDVKHTFEATFRKPPGNGPEMTETDTKGPFETERTPEGDTNRMVDIQTAFRRMSGWD